MFARSLRWRVAVIVAGLLTVLLWVAPGGAGTSVIIIEFGMDPQTLEGAEVLINDEYVGHLQRMGSRTQTGFKVSDGLHRVSVRHPRYGSTSTEVTSGAGEERVMLMADFESRWEDGKQETVIVLRE